MMSAGGGEGYQLWSYKMPCVCPTNSEAWEPSMSVPGDNFNKPGMGRHWGYLSSVLWGGCCTRLFALA